MANGVNRVFLVGNIGQEPELREVGTSAVLDFSLATTESYQDREGTRQQRTEWHTVKVWGKRARALGGFLAKGMMVCVEGSIRTETWEKDGQKRSKTTIVASNLELLKGLKNTRNDQGDDDDNVPF
jgi:single-strand DNA-binding protein